MTTLREAAQQALEMLERLHGGCTDSDDGTVEAITVWCPEIITALRAALAEDAMQKLTDIQQEMERSIDSLKAALPKELKLKEQVNPDLPVGCKRCTHPLWCGIKCDACGKVWDWAAIPPGGEHL